MLRELFDRPPHHDSKNQPLSVGFFFACFPEVEGQLQQVFHVTGQLQVRTTGWCFPVGDHAQFIKSGAQSDRVFRRRRSTIAFSSCAVSKSLCLPSASFALIKSSIAMMNTCRPHWIGDTRDAPQSPTVIPEGGEASSASQTGLRSTRRASAFFHHAGLFASSLMSNSAALRNSSTSTPSSPGT